MKKDKQGKKVTDKQHAKRAESIELVAHWAMAALNKIINVSVTKEQVPIEQEKKRFYDDLSKAITQAFRKDTTAVPSIPAPIDVVNEKETPTFETEIVTDWEATAKAMRAIAETAVAPLIVLFQGEDET